MFASHRSLPVRVAALLAVVACALVTVIQQPVRISANAPASAIAALTTEEAIDLVTAADGTLHFDVAEDGTRFVWQGDPVLTDGFPSRSTAYITQGYIYPEGTLDGTNGVLEDGSPEFPDKVLGQWTCYGWWIGDPAHAGKSPAWLTTHLFNFGADLGEATLVSDGYSIDDMNLPLARAIVGGTGAYAGALGVQMETNLGYNPSKGIDVRYEVRLTAV